MKEKKTYECLICGDHIESEKSISSTKLCEGCGNGVYREVK